MYEAGEDPYCYPGSAVLKNRLGIRSPDRLSEYEGAITSQRAEEPSPPGTLDEAHYRAIHRHLFQDVFDWAGDYRTVRLSKQDSTFCYPEHIAREMKRLFAQLAADKHLKGLTDDAFAKKAAHFLSELNAIHPFREGNGRAQNSFMKILADEAGHPLDLARLDPVRMMGAMVASFNGDEGPLAAVILDLIARR